jgi:hypothetical protein
MRPRPHLLHLLASALFIVLVDGARALDPAPAAEYSAAYAELCAACAQATEEDVSNECFGRMSRACEYQPEEVDPAMSPRVMKILNAYSFCIGFTAPSVDSLSMGARMRIVQWKERVCPNSSPSHDDQYKQEV